MESAGEAVALGEHLRRVVQPTRQLFEVVGVPLQGVGDRSFEQLSLGVEVIVEGADAEVGRFGMTLTGAFVRPSASSACAASISARRVRAFRR